jgi:Mg/Co/Ni transporter MgtE
MESWEEDDDEGEMVYVVKDINKFVDETRRIVFGAFGETSEEMNLDDFIDQLSDTDIEELDKTLSHEECMAILHDKVTPRKNYKGELKYVISEEKFSEIIEDFNSRLVSNLLNELVSKGLLETGWSDEDQDFIFWLDEKSK